MSEVHQGPSEGELLEEMLGIISTNVGHFKLGVLMGVMRKGDSIYISRLERELKEQHALVEELTQQLAVQGVIRDAGEI